MIGFLLLPLALTALVMGRLLPIMIAGVLLLAVAVFALQRVTRSRAARATATDRRDAAEGTSQGPLVTPQPTHSSVEFPHPVFSEVPATTDTVSAARNSAPEFAGSAQ